MKITQVTVPAFVKTTFLFLFCAWGVLLLSRCATFALVVPGLYSTLPVPPNADILTALYIGAKFDARIAVFLTGLLALLLFIPWVDRRVRSFRYLLDAVYGGLFAVVEMVYIIDYGYFFYLRQRVDGTLWGFLKDAGISFDMLVQTYPIILIWIAFALTTALFVFLFDCLLRWHIGKTDEEHLDYDNLWRVTGGVDWKRRGVWGFCTLLSMTVLAYGQLSSNLFPLRWSNAYFSTNRDLVLLGLNPVQNLIDTLRNTRVIAPSVQAARTAYPEMAAWLRVDRPDEEKLDFWRTVRPAPGTPKRNVVLIIMESLSWPMTSFAPGDDDPTPNLRELAAGGVCFSNYYASARTTARAVFSIMTGIPDVNRNGGTSTSRNQTLVRQYLPISDFKGYDKYYMIGGSASWANIRGVLQHNVQDLHLLEERFWKAPNVDVWGISDLNLFREGVEVLNESGGKQFVAVIQTSGFHRPYTIPKDNAGFTERTPGREIIRNYGFAGDDEYNSLRLSDHALGEFFRLASKAPWFKDTIFAIVGDHGLWNPSQNMSGGYLASALQGYHVPLIVYAPGLLKPARNAMACGHADLFPTLAKLAGVSVRIHGTGRDLFDPATAKDARQYIAGDEEHFRILVEGDYCYVRKSSEGLYRLDDLEGRNLLATDSERASRMRRFAEAYYQTAKYLLFNNREQPE